MFTKGRLDGTHRLGFKQHLLLGDELWLYRVRDPQCTGAAAMAARILRAAHSTSPLEPHRRLQGTPLSPLVSSLQFSVRVRRFTVEGARKEGDPGCLPLTACPHRCLSRGCRSQCGRAGGRLITVAMVTRSGRLGGGWERQRREGNR